ncbi:putative protein TPRXL [Salarias fasciatus]|uniref:Uncharacterized protein n=1 Tax=Salarias fasciatus TaxID=181472 RepID=A0A672J9R7_SALFA|nr:putative protein TPRXL [Salarias fasciatus]
MSRQSAARRQMMETKLWAALCALLLVNSGSADHSEDHAAAAPTTSSGVPVTGAGPVTKAAYSEPGPTLRPTSHGLSDSDPNTSLQDTSSLSNSTATSQEVTVVTSTSEKNINSTTQLQSEPPATSVDLPSTSHTPDSAITISPTHIAQSFSVDVTATQSPDSSTSHKAASVLPDSTSDQLSPPKTTSSSLVAVSQSAQPERTAAASITLSTSTSSATSSPQTHNSPSSAHTLSSESHRETTTKAPVKSSTSAATLPNGPSAQAKTHTDSLSQLNVGNDPTMVHDSPTLDPLLAGLVTAFIITAVIITLLLFLKLRRRDNRPEFRRLQDLPMDDMMEDTPLSMYSY